MQEPRKWQVHLHDGRVIEIKATKVGRTMDDHALVFSRQDGTKLTFRWGAVEYFEEDPLPEPPKAPEIVCARCGNGIAGGTGMTDNVGRHWHVNCAAQALVMQRDPKVEV